MRLLPPCSRFGRSPVYARRRDKPFVLQSTAREALPHRTVVNHRGGHCTWLLCVCSYNCVHWLRAACPAASNSSATVAALRLMPRMPAEAIVHILCIFSAVPCHRAWCKHLRRKIRCAARLGIVASPPCAGRPCMQFSCRMRTKAECPRGLRSLIASVPLCSSPNASASCAVQAVHIVNSPMPGAGALPSRRPPLMAPPRDGSDRWPFAY